MYFCIPKQKLMKKILTLIVCLLGFSIQVVFAEEKEVMENALPADSLIKAYLHEEYGITTTHNNHLRLLTTAREKFEVMFDEIKKAKHHVHLEYFNFRNDSIANALFDLLAEKAAQGVEVRALYDDFGNMSNNQPLQKHHLKALWERGVEIYPYDPVKFPWVNHVLHRDHRKIVVIDGKAAYIGGMNVADYYIHGLPEVGPWRDMHVRITGDAVSELQGIFVRMWLLTTNELLAGSPYFPEHVAALGKEVAIIDRAPRMNAKTMRRTYAQAIRSAQHTIQLVNPYFVPTPMVKKALKDALKRGVKVEIMLPGKSDIKMTPDGGMYVANSLRKKGADIYVFNKGFHHTKVLMVDSLYCSLGSCNLDARSLRFDHEVQAYVFDKETTLQLINIFDKDKLDSTLMTADTYKQRKAWNRFLGWFAHLLTPFL